MKNTFPLKGQVSLKIFYLYKIHNSIKNFIILGRQKVKLAAQLLSNTTANAIRRCYSLGIEIYEAIETADFFQLVNDWFDVLNSKLSTFAYLGKVIFFLNIYK